VIPEKWAGEKWKTAAPSGTGRHLYCSDRRGTVIPVWHVISDDVTYMSGYMRSPLSSPGQ